MGGPHAPPPPQITDGSKSPCQIRLRPYTATTVLQFTAWISEKYLTLRTQFRGKTKMNLTPHSVIHAGFSGIVLFLSH